MSVPGEVRYGIERLYVFPYYQTREEYQKATGVEPPKFDGTRAPKYWFDPAAKESTRRNMAYDHILSYAVNGSPLFDDNGKPMLEVLMLNKDEAATVNIPPKGLGMANIPGADKPEIPPPLRALNADEEFFVPFPGIIGVRIKNSLEPDRGFTEEDRAILMAIAKKLGV
ncbi:MAG: hypothetical protein JNM66_02350 [Bryobacterales bacterium]|nr:hypothetical protein [Bryobacterales bacterium]